MAAQPDPKLTSVADFELSITKALRDQLTAQLKKLVARPLDDAALASLKESGGVYVLHQGVERVYIGKAKSSLRQRLGNHHRKLSGRANINLADINFIALYVKEDLDAVAPEKLLINDLRPPWNYNGFGNKDPGKNRDRTVVKAVHFDAKYPVDLGKAAPLVPVQAPHLEGFLVLFKKLLPFNLRYAKKPADLMKVLKDLPPPVLPAGATIEEAFEAIVRALPEGWQLTELPGYAILYRESAEYPSAQAWWRKAPNGDVIRTAGDFKLAAGAIKPPVAEDDEEDGEEDEEE